MKRLFLDSAFSIALAAPNDQYHAQAVSLAEHIESEDMQLITTRAVVLEIGNALAKQRYRQAAIALLEALEADPRVEIVPVSEQLCRRGFQLYHNRDDKGWGLTDCVSFVVMQEQGLTEALTPDEHFQQAGFRALLRES
jgi:hypothetical protein